MIGSLRLKSLRPSNSNVTSLRSAISKAQPLRHSFQTCVPRKAYPQPPQQPSDEPDFTSYIDKPPQYVSVGRNKNVPGLILLLSIPVISFLLGTWQIKRLEWKTDLIIRSEDSLIKPPLQLPPRLDPDAIHEFDYRRVFAEGVLRHDQEMLVTMRVRDGKNGFLVITPLERENGSSKVLVNRGWIPKEFEKHESRKQGLPSGKVTVEGLLREPFKKNMFTPNNNPEKGQWYFQDVKEMAAWSGSNPVWIEETMEQDLLEAYDREAVGAPIGRAAAVDLRNNHAQYIFTWYALCFATSIMFWKFVRKPPADVVRRARRSSQW